MGSTRILNEGIELPGAARRNFLRGQAERVLLEPGHEIFKFSQSPPEETRDGVVTPWWMSVEPLNRDDPGLEGLRSRSRALGHGPAGLARARAAVSLGWNAMTELRHVRLVTAAYAFYGRCAPQLMDDQSPALANVVFIGGAWQLFIPNLTPTCIAAV